MLFSAAAAAAAAADNNGRVRAKAAKK